MLAPGHEDRIAHIQQQIDEVVSLGVIGVELLGGPDAVKACLHHTLAHLTGVAIAKQGQESALELMVYGYVNAEDYDPERPRC